MTLNRTDLAKLTLPAGIFVLLCAISAGLTWHTTERAKQSALALQQATNSRNQIEQRLRQVRTEEQDVRVRTQRYQDLQKAGVIGNEKRLDWVETLHDIQRELRIPGLRYEFGPQLAMAQPDNGWYASPLRLQLRLLHEGDLLNLLALIEQRTNALVIVRRCKILPVTTTGEGNSPPAQLSGECELQYLTVRPASSRP